MNRKLNSMIRMASIFIFWAAIFIGPASTVWSAESDYYGTYAGSFTGDDSGYWVAVISSSSSDSVFLSYSTTYDNGDGGYLNFYTESSGVGNYYSYSVMNASYIDAYITASTGSASGTWSNSTQSGTFSGNAITSSPQAGIYSGSIAGDATGTWSMTVGTDGYITGSITVGGETSSFEGGAHPEGYIVTIGTDPDGYDFSVFGQISGTSASGSWTSESGTAGTFTTVSGSSGGSGGSSGGSSGGCFIGLLAQ